MARLVSWILLVSLLTPGAAVGGLGAAQEATAEIQNLIEPLRASALAKAQKRGYSGADFEIWKAVSFKTQVVAGRTYFVKVQVGSDSFVHLRIFEPLPHTKMKPEVVAMELGHSEDSELSSFFNQIEL
ncbi:CSTB [Symbiodinium sp. CCMP2592]|nr:CSTB [Symbiodinium sp. CCMP2592]